MFKTYLSEDEYSSYSDIIKDDIVEYTSLATRDIDIITLHSIKDFDSLTDVQKEIIRYVAAEHSDFLYQYKEELKTMVTSYSVEGISYSTDNVNYVTVLGVKMHRNLYSLLLQTGLCNTVLY